MRPPPIPRQIVPSVRPAKKSPASVAREFRALLDAGAKLRVDGRKKGRPRDLLRLGYTPKHRVDLFAARIYLSNPRQIPELKFCVAYVIPDFARAHERGRPQRIHARIYYKDLSLVWRVASHMTYDQGSLWIGKGDVELITEADGYERVESMEETSDLPLELQGALEDCSSAVKRPSGDPRVLEWVLRRSSPSRIEPYDDFTAPRRRAAADPRNRIHAGRKVARLRRRSDPTSLVFVRGYEPDFRSGLLERTYTPSRLYGGRVGRYRILSRNRQIQYLFFASPTHVWIVPPQATTTELSSYGVRTIDVAADGDIFIPGWEYHYLDTDHDPPEIYSQIPAGFAGVECPLDDQKADASPWLERLPVIRRFRRTLFRPAPKSR